jgi:predicted dehydrogenase
MRPIDRRQFLSESAFLAACAAAAGPFESRLGAAEQARAAKAGPANERLRVAVIGVNGRGRDHVGGFAGRHNCVVTTICDADPAVIGRAMKAAERAQKKGKGVTPRFEQDLRKVVADKDIDIVSIATPNHWHALAAVWALQNGKHVYVEKPVSHNVSEGRRIVQAAQAAGKVCFAGTQSRSMKGMREAIAFLHEGGLGKVKLAKGFCYKLRPSIGKTKGPQPTPSTVDYDLWCGPAAKLPLTRKRLHYDWHWVWNTGNGDLGNQGIHEVDKARWGLNKGELPYCVRSVGGRLGYVDDGETPNTQVTHFDYGDSELVFEVRGWPSDSPFPGKASPQTGPKPGNFVGNVWYGEKGFLVCPSYSGGVAYTHDGEIIKRFGGGGDHYGNFVAAVRSGKKDDQRSILDGHLSSALCHLANISLRLGGLEALDKTNKPFQSKAADEALAGMAAHLDQNPIHSEGLKVHVGRKLTIDRKAEAFVGDKQADAMLTREYRAGFVVPDKV